MSRSLRSASLRQCRDPIIRSLPIQQCFHRTAEIISDFNGVVMNYYGPKRSTYRHSFIEGARVKHFRRQHQSENNLQKNGSQSQRKRSIGQTETKTIKLAHLFESPTQLRLQIFKQILAEKWGTTEERMKNEMGKGEKMNTTSWKWRKDL